MIERFKVKPVKAYPLVIIKAGLFNIKDSRAATLCYLAWKFMGWIASAGMHKIFEHG